ncbi:MAG: MBL fold metallo-hydrolase [Pyrinomonadaceae bacterium]
MSNENLYLRQNVQLEPLFNQWYAWPHLISPLTAAMNVANSHVKIMKSFVTAPEIHAAAVKNPAMRGGPFLDVPPRRSPEVKALLERTLKEQKCLIEFSEAVKTLNSLLLNEANGSSMESLYAKVPEPLQGYVELVYDINSNPTIRVIEGLLYRSPYYDESLQSLDLSLINSDHRPFVFSTPRFHEEGHVWLRLPFADEALDELFRMRETPQTYDYIKDRLGVGADQDEVFKTFFTPEAPRRTPPYDGDDIRIRYLNHACILVETKGVSIMTDPIVSYEYESDIGRYTFADLPERIDYVLLTHTHSDHIMFETLLQLRSKIGTIIVPRAGGGALEDPSAKLILQQTGFKNVIEIDEMESISIPGGSIMGLPFFGEHGDLNIRTRIAHLIMLNGRRILCAADSRNIEPKLYERIHKVTGDIDVLFLGMECEGAPLSWMYGALLTKALDRKMDQSRRLNGSDCDRGLDIVNRFNCQQVYIYAMGQEPWLSYVTSIVYDDKSIPIVESDRLIAACRDVGKVSERIYGAKEMFLESYP